MVNLGGFFKEIGTNPIIKQAIANGIEQNTPIADMLQPLLDDGSLIDTLKTYIEDVAVVEEKLKTFIGQQVKKAADAKAKKEAADIAAKEKAKKEADEAAALSNSFIEDDTEEEDEEDIELEVQPCVPPRTQNPIWLYAGCFIERMIEEHRTHLVTPEHEYYY